MIDSVLKGTGNSRFLKSAVPAGTSWADALAMLQAGTFPVDFNGINAEGFQQVGTPLNKANLLKDATAAQIGLPPSTTPDGMFQALGNTGELHVWRKTVTSGTGTTTTYPVSTNPNAYQEGSDAKEAGYVLGDVVTGKFGMGMRYASIVFEYSVASEISASDNGTISLKNPTTFTIGGSGGYPGVASNVTAAIAGKYIQLEVMGSATSLMSGPFSSAPSSIVYIPSDTIATREDIEDGNTQTWYFIDRYQPVTGYAAIPAGTTIEYLGKLGDKARVQVVSYVGTGTSGSDNPVSITFNFVPKSIWVIGKGYSYESEIHLMHGDASKNSGNVYYFAFSRISWESKTVSWYNTRNDGDQASALQANKLGETYKVLAIC